MEENPEIRAPPVYWGKRGFVLGIPSDHFSLRPSQHPILTDPAGCRCPAKDPPD